MAPLELPDHDVDDHREDRDHHEELQHASRVVGGWGRPRLNPVKELAIYTVLRLLLFVAVLAVVLGVWIKVAGSGANLLWPVIVAFALSGVISLFLLSSPREAAARRVEQRAARAAAKYDELRAKED